jgi:predicted DNA-binding transcriptional regulator AlpA
MNSIETPQAVSGGQDLTATRYGSKRDVAAMIQMSPRTVDSLIARGCPHLRISSRALRFDLEEVRSWLAENFRTQRRAVKGGAL